MATVIVTTAASATKLINNPPNIIAKTIVGAVLQNAPLAETLVANINFGFNASVDDYYRYGRDHFVNGLGTGRQFNVKANEEIRADILSAIQIDDPSAISIFSLSIDEVEPRKLLIDILERDPAYELNYLPQFSLSGNTIPDEPIFVKLVSTGQVYFLPFTKDLDFSVFTLTANIPVGLDQNQTIPPLAINVTVNYARESTIAFNVIYTTNTGALAFSGLSNYRRWVYSPSTSIHPILDQYSTLAIGRFFYPIAPIRVDNVNLVDEDFSNEALRTTTDSLLKKIGIDLEEFSEQIVDPSNPSDIDDVDHMFVMFAANLNSSEKVAQNYLYEYFRQNYYTQFADQVDWLATGTPRNIYLMSGGRTTIQLMWNFISIEVKGGNIGDPHAAYDSSIIVPDSLPGNPIDPNNSGNDDIAVEVIIGTETFVEAAQFPFNNDHVMIYRKQLTTGGGATFVELVVHGLQHNLDVHHEADTIHRSPGDMSDGGFFIPISRDIVRSFNGLDESEIFFETLVLVSYAIDFNKLKWYQEPAFIELVAFVVLIISIVTYDFGGFGDAVRAGVAALLEYAAKSYVIGILIGEILELLINLLGPEYALILAAIAGVIAIQSGSDATKVLGKLLSAEELLRLATLTINAVNTNTEEQFLELQEEREIFEQEIADRQEELEAAQATLDTGVDIELYTLITPVGYTNFTEAPDAFFNRSIEETNPGVLALEAIDNFIENAFELPKGLQA